MPKFTKIDPAEVVLGRGRSTLEARKMYVEAVRSMDAGKIELQSNDRPTTVKRLLQEAAREVGVKLRSSWTDERQQVLIWKKTSKR
jgi:hypothetical protein